MKDEYIIINRTVIQKRIEELEKDPINLQWEHDVRTHNGHSPKQREKKNKIDLELNTLKDILSQSTPLIPDIKDIQIWLSKQSYQKEYGEQEYMMYYDVDIPKIIQDYISNLKLDI